MNVESSKRRHPSNVALAPVLPMKRRDGSTPWVQPELADTVNVEPAGREPVIIPPLTAALMASHVLNAVQLAEERTAPRYIAIVGAARAVVAYLMGDDA